MPRARSPGSHAGTPEYREEVRTQVVVHGLATSEEIARETDVPHARVVRILQRFAAVGALALAGPFAPSGAVEVVPGSLSARFRDLSLPLW